MFWATVNRGYCVEVGQVAWLHAGGHSAEERRQTGRDRSPHQIPVIDDALAPAISQPHDLSAVVFVLTLGPAWCAEFQFLRRSALFQILSLLKLGVRNVCFSSAEWKHENHQKAIHARTRSNNDIRISDTYRKDGPKVNKAQRKQTNRLQVPVALTATKCCRECRLPLV